MMWGIVIAKDQFLIISSVVELIGFPVYLLVCAYVYMLTDT